MENTTLNTKLNKNEIIIRKETKEDYSVTEHMVMRAFWNLHEPGCNEHYLVHILRQSLDYMPNLSRVAEIDGRIVGLIMYSKAKVVDGDKTHEIITFGPLCVEPTCSNMGIGKRLLEETIDMARQEGYAGICIYGEPDYYPKHGFKTCDNYGITDPNGNNYSALMGYKLSDEFDNVHGKLYESPVFEECLDMDKVLEYEKQFPYYKKLKLECQWLHDEKLGRICEISKNSYKIKFWEKEYEAKLKGSFYREEEINLPVVGDYVTFKFNPIGESVILSVCERKSFLKRPDQAKTGVDQYMVSNVDYVFIVTALNKDYNFNRIARYVSVVLGGNATPIVVLTKSDLCSNPGRYVSEVENLSDKVRVHAISALYDIGVDELNEYLKPGNTICLLGSSGAGKSTLVNAISNKDIMKTSGIREADSKGRHTTTHRQLIELENNVTIIDTPGMRELGMADVSDGINDTFSDIVEIANRCKFRNCKHDTEPGCAIKAALESNELSFERYELYKKLQLENMGNTVKNHDKKKEISKMLKKSKKVIY